jgi:HlyD family secretion protein
MRKWLVVAVVVVVIAVIGIVLVRRFGPQSAQAATVTIYTVRPSQISNSVTASGSLAPVNDVTVSWGAGGDIVEVPAKLGDAVAPGQKLARLDIATLEGDVASGDAGLAAAQTGLASARASLKDLEAGPSADTLETAQIGLNQAKDRRWSAQSQRDATCGRVADKMANQVDCDSAQASVLSAEDAVKLAELQLRQAQRGPTDVALAAARDKVAQAQSSLRAAEARLQTARAALDAATATAPISGTVTSLTAVAGAKAKDGDPVAVISDLSAFEVSLNVGETDVSKLKVGGKADVTVDAFPGETLTGEIEEIAPAAQVQSGVVLYPVKVRVAKANQPLRVGMSATVAMITAAVADALVVPVQAVQTVNGQSFVMRLPADAAATALAGEFGGAIAGTRAPSAAGRLSGTPGARIGGLAGRAFGTPGARGGASGPSGRAITVPLARVSASLERVPVTLGISTDTQVQVVSGLSAGDRVVVTTGATTGTSTTNTQNNRGGGFGFGVPFGGPPDGRGP